MVVQKIKFDFMQSKLDDIRVVQGDTCRDIEFEASDIHGEISPENYTFTFNLLKPDHTFVIVTLSSNILTITEQMWAITGTSYYCIRIKDSNDELIYSGQGAFIVDDQVISETDIESVAEVNGYVFPDDFATTEQIESVVESLGFAKIADNRQNLTETWSSEHIADKIASGAGDLIHDNQIAEDHTWSSDKINTELLDKAVISDNAQSTQTTWSSEKIAEELSEIEVLDIYSTTEKIVGTWIDNSPVYEKTVSNEMILSNSWTNYMDASTVDKIISVDMRCTRDNEDVPASFSYNEVASWIRRDNYIKVCITSGTAGWKILSMTIRYTKTQ